MRYHEPYGAASDSSYVNGNPAIGLRGSIPPGEAIENPQREMVNLIADVGFTPTDADLHQLAKSIQIGSLNFSVDSGTANAMVVALVPAPNAYKTGMRVYVVKGAAASSTTTPTIDVNSLGAKAIKNANGGALTAGDLAANAYLILIYDGVNFRLISGAIASGGGGGGGGSVTQSDLEKAAFPTRTVYSTPGTYTFTVPTGVTKVFARIWGAGGSGGNGQANISGGSGGGGGGYSERICTVTTGQTITVTVGAGAGGNGVGSLADGSSGGASSFGSFCSATGGLGGQRGISSGNPGTPIGGGGSGAGGDLNLVGATGDSGATGTGTGSATGYGGRGGAAAWGGSGGCMSTGSSGPGLWPGGGGSAGGASSALNTSSGAGAAGGVILQYVS